MFVAIAIGTLYAIALRSLFHWHRLRRVLEPFTAGHLLGLPFSAGFLTILAAGPENPFVWSGVPILLYSLIILLLRWQRLLSVLLNLPIFVMMSLLGGLAGSVVFQLAIDPVSMAAIAATLPVIVSFIETRRPAKYRRIKVRTSAVVDASPDTIWERIVRVDPIRDREWGAYRLFALLGFPAPQRAELDFDGPGGLRLGIFSDRVLFREPVAVWQPGRRVAFDIHVNAAAVDKLPFDEFTRVGGRYFGLERAEYILEPLPEGRIRLHLNSVQTVHTRLNWYASLWGRLILGAFQRNILALVKARCEMAEGLVSKS